MEVALQLRTELLLLGGQVDEVQTARWRGLRQIGRRGDGALRVLVAQVSVAGQELDGAGGEAVQGADQLFVLGVFAVKDRAFRGQGGEPLLVLGKGLEHLPGVIVQLPGGDGLTRGLERVFECVAGDVFQGLDAAGVEPESAAFLTTFGEGEVSILVIGRSLGADIDGDIDVKQQIHQFNGPGEWRRL